MSFDKYCYTAPIRHILTVLMFFSLAICYTHRVVMHVAIIEIVKPHKKRNDACTLNLRQKDEKFVDRTIDWSEREQHFILMGFYVGYCLAHIGSGYMVDRLGARHPMLWGNVLSALANASIPFVANIHYLYVVLLRILVGIGQAPLLPGCATLINFWVPQHSRALMSALTFAGVPLGTFAGIYITGVAIVYFDNWTIIFYAWSSLTVPWFIFFAYYIHSYPEVHPRLDAIGSSYIKSSFIQSNTDKIPLRVIMTSKGVWAETVSTFGHCYLLFTLVTYLPKYVNHILNFTLADVTWLTSLPFGTMWYISFLLRQLNTFLVHDKNVNKEVLRVINSTMSHLVAGLCVFGAALSQCHIYASLSLFTLGATFQGFFYGGANLLDLSTVHPAFVMSVINGLASTSGVITTGLALYFIKQDTLHEWFIIFGIALGVSVISWLIDMVLGNAHYELKQNTDAANVEQKPKKWYQELPDEDFQILLAKRSRNLTET